MTAAKASAVAPLSYMSHFGYYGLRVNPTLEQAIKKKRAKHGIQGYLNKACRCLEKISSKPCPEMKEIVAEVKAPVAVPAAANHIEIDLAGGHRMRISGGYDPEALARLIRGLTV